jgi:hypothetical protein
MKLSTGFKVDNHFDSFLKRSVPGSFDPALVIHPKKNRCVTIGEKLLCDKE